MKTNTPLPEKEKAENPIKRKTVTVGEQPKHTFEIAIGFSICLLIFGLISYTFVCRSEIKEKAPIVKMQPILFEPKQIKEFFKIIPVAQPVPTKEPQSKKIVKVSNQTTRYPAYHDYDDLILAACKKYNIKRCVIIKAIIEQESHYNKEAKRYEAKWERDYGRLIPRKNNESLKEWRMNFYSFGLMQVGYALHKDFCDLKHYTDLINPATNIDCGTKLFDACLDEGNSEVYCIKRYNGSGDATEIYKNKILIRMAKIAIVPTEVLS